MSHVINITRHANGVTSLEIDGKAQSLNNIVSITFEINVYEPPELHLHLAPAHIEYQGPAEVVWMGALGEEE